MRERDEGDRPAMKTFTYDSDLIGGSLMVRENRVIADLMLRQASPEEWQQEIQVENRLQKRSPATAKRLAQSIRKRLERAIFSDSAS